MTIAASENQNVNTISDVIPRNNNHRAIPNNISAAINVIDASCNCTRSGHLLKV